MSRNRKNQPISVRLAPAAAAVISCLFIGGSAMGYVWQKDRIHELGQQIKKHEQRLDVLRRQNHELARHLSILKSPSQLDARVRKLALGLVPPQPEQVLRLVEAPVAIERIAVRPANAFARNELND
jgi:cell division protein FtsB